MYPWLLSIVAGFMISLVSLVGAFTLFIPIEKLKSIVQFLVSLAVGVLLGDAFLHLIPDAVARTNNLNNVMIFTLAGMLLFFFLEKVVRWNHDHEVYEISSAPGESKPQPYARMNLIGDAIHNFVDGTLIAGSFMVDIKFGITTTLAIIIHEIPQEIGDIGTLVHGGYTPRRAIWLNFICSLTCVAGVIVVLLLGNLIEIPLTYILPIAAGGFIYIASSDLIPILHQRTKLYKHFIQGAVICAGVASMLIITWIEQTLQ